MPHADDPPGPRQQVRVLRPSRPLRPLGQPVLRWPVRAGRRRRRGRRPPRRRTGAGRGHRTGRVPLAIARALPGLRVEGLDLSTEMVAQARRNATDAGLDDAVRFTVGDVADLPYADATFDLVVSTMSQHHWADAAAGLRELRRVLRPGAQVWIYDVRFALGRAEAAARADRGGLGGPPWSLLSAVSWVAEDRPGLGVTDRTQAALWASRHGLADDSD